MKNLKYIISIALIFSILFSINIFASGYTKISGSTYATVTGVIDGDAIRVKLSSGETAYVKLAGITSDGYDGAYTYLNQKILGSDVLLVSDGTSSSTKWNYMLVYYNGLNLNQELVEKGYAVIDNTQSKTSINTSLVTAQSSASSYGSGIWAYSSSTASTLTGQSGATISGSKININTATQAQLKKYLNNISDTLAANIVAYRTKNPFNTISEIKFVDGMTKDIYTQNKNIITVSTNINTALDIELKSLRELSDDQVDAIIEYRTSEEFEEINEIIDIIGYSKYSSISPYISVSDESEVFKTYNSYIANINGADKTYMAYTGLSSSNAGIVTSYRTNGYTYKTLFELLNLPGFSLSEKDLNYLEDNLQVMTNLNPNSKEELNSLFGSTLASVILSTDVTSSTNLKSLLSSSAYEKVKDYVYVDNYSSEYVNLNTASTEQLTNAGFTYNQAIQIINARPITNASILPFNVADFNTKVSLYTNINTASTTELASLNNGITASIILNIKNYVKDQPFGSLDEFKQYLNSLGEYELYSKIKDFIVFR